MKNISSFKIYSLGIVAVDKNTKSDIIDVVPIEHLTDISGDIGEETTFESSATDHKNVPSKAETKAKNSLKASWLAFGHSNRSSSPDVIKGETVLLFTYSDTNEYYWTTIFREPLIRRLEKVLYSYSNLPKDERITAFDRDSSYWIEVDTMNKYIKVHTANNDSEVTTYDLTIDTKEGYVDIRDGLGNYIKLDSVKNRITHKANAEIIHEAPSLYLNGNVVISQNLNVHGNIDGNGHIWASETISGSSCLAAEHPKSGPGGEYTPSIFAEK